MRRARHDAVHHASDFGQFLHQAALVVQAPCGIDDDHFGIASHGGFQGVEGYGCRVRAHVLGDNVYAGAFRPNLQLINGRCAKGIRCTEQHALPCLLVTPSQFADGRSLTDAVDTDDHDDAGLAGGRFIGGGGTLCILGKQPADLLAQHRVQFLNLCIRFKASALAQTVEDFHGGVHPHIGRDQCFFQVIHQLLVHAAAAGEDLRQLLEDIGP